MFVDRDASADCVHHARHGGRHECTGPEDSHGDGARCDWATQQPSGAGCRCRCVALCAGCSVLQLVVESYICKLVVSGLCWPGTPRHTTTGCHFAQWPIKTMVGLGICGPARQTRWPALGNKAFAHKQPSYLCWFFAVKSRTPFVSWFWLKSLCHSLQLI